MTVFEFPEPRIKNLSIYANLRQAVEWIAYGYTPVSKKYESIIRKVENIQNSDEKEIDHAKRLLVLALYENKLIAKALKEGDPSNTVYWEEKWLEIPEYAWDLDNINWDDSTLFYPHMNKSFIRIYIPTSILKEVFSNPLNNKSSFVTSKSKINVRPSYLSPYMKLLDLAVTEFNITASNQPATKILIDWFYNKLKEMPGEMYLSMTKARMLATFVREPEAQKGGLKKLNKNQSK